VTRRIDLGVGSGRGQSRRTRERRSRQEFAAIGILRRTRFDIVFLPAGAFALALASSTSENLPQFRPVALPGQAGSRHRCSAATLANAVITN
jgi:hypothetical protein